MAQPTSRKKYYLQIAIEPEWPTSSNFLSDLRHHIESISGQSLRDIFIANSERRGQFYVANQQIGDKLVSLFATSNISCRGRKPHATMVERNKNQFELHLSNINNVMNTEEFCAWVLSLHCDASGIQLFAPSMTAPATDCILSFNTIDTAICVKQKLQNVKFRQVPLYFRHWHVPRRILNDKVTQKHHHKIGIVLGLIDNSSVSSGYSSGSPIAIGEAGPLYLRDQRVPPPPKREPPPPPMAIATHTKQYLDPISLEETRMSYEANMSYVSSLHHRLEEQEQMIQRLMDENKYISHQLGHVSQTSKYMERKYGSLHLKYQSLYHLNKILCWNGSDVIQWISSLENGRFIKYKEYLIYVNGSVLSKLNKCDLHRLGIVHPSDQTSLIHHIHSLMSKYHA
eukprot:248490_1